MKNAALRGKPDAGNPHVRFDEGEVAPAKPRRGFLPYKLKTLLAAGALLTTGLGFADGKNPTLFFAGDSTLDDYGESQGGKAKPPYASWGTALTPVLREGCRIGNFAHCGCSTKSFQDEGRWEKLIAEVGAGDFVVIQFGHNDQKRATEEQRKALFATPNGLYRENLRKFAAEVRAKGATPVFCTPIVRATFDARGEKLVDTAWASEGITLETYAKAVRETGAELKVDVVDMNRLTGSLCECVGREAAYGYFLAPKDTTHPIRRGADAFARLFYEDVRVRKLKVASLFRDVTVTIESEKLVRDSDTTIDAIIAVKEAADAALASEVKVLPLPSGSARNDAFNREMPWLSRGKLKWAGPARKGGDDEDGSHLFRTENRKGDKNWPWWYVRMKEKRDEIRASNGQYDVVMLGDSITHGWDLPSGRGVLADLRKTYSVLVLGYGGDKADTLLWRMRNGELEGYKAKVFTILIGTNNHVADRDTPERTAGTIGKIVETIRAKQPQAKIMLMAIFPRLSPEQGRFRARNQAAARLIEKYADGENVIWCDMRPLLTKEDGTGRFDLLADGTHPSPTGFRVWRDAMLPYFEKYTGKHHTPNDVLKEPCARRWYTAGVDVANDESCRAFNRLVTYAGWMGYNGVCATVRNGGEWNAAAEKRMDGVVGTCRDCGLELVPVLGQQTESDFAATLERVKKLVDPQTVFIGTNGTVCADKNQLRENTVREIAQVTTALPKADIVLFAKPFVGNGAGIPRHVTMAASGDFGYIREKKWPAMLLIDAESKDVRQWNMHTPFCTFRDSYRASGPKEGFLYWTTTDDYRLLLDAVRVGMRQE